MKLAGKTALVCGTSPNIGGGIAEGLAAVGARTVCADINPDYSNGCARSIWLKPPSRKHYAKATVFLASDDAEMITAFDLRVDAGSISKYWIWDLTNAVE